MSKYYKNAFYKRGFSRFDLLMNKCKLNELIFLKEDV